MAEPSGESELELILAKLLSGGVLLSAGLLILGMAGLLFTGHTGYPAGAMDLGRVHPEAYPHAIASLITGLKEGRPLAIMALGLLVLVLTPVLRVASSIVLFLRQRDFLYAGLCAFVFGMLLLGMLVAAE